MEFKDIIKKLRLEKSMSQADLARELHAGVSTIASWETGARYPTRAKMEWLADIFNVDLDYLYGKTDIRQKVHFDGDGNLMISVSNDELEMLEAYRVSDDTTKEMVNRLLNYHQLLFPLFKEKDGNHDT